jgi:hypothetical protein
MDYDITCLTFLLPEAATLLRSFFHSSEKRERWVSATILGCQQEEEALPIILSMLTDELPLERPAGIAYDAWYDCWRSYAPHLLRERQFLEKDTFLLEALHIWFRSEALFDPEYDAWERCEEALIDELGYYGDLTALKAMILDDEQRKKLQLKISGSPIDAGASD